MDHSTRELREMLRGMGVEFSDDDTYEELKALFHEENHRRWMGVKRLDGARVPSRTKRVIRRRKGGITKPLDAETRPLLRPENERLSAASAGASMPKEGRKPTFPRPQRPVMKQHVPVTMEREIPPVDKIAGPKRDVLKSVMRRADNCCELCEDANAPDRLEPFYLTPLDEGGTKTVKNVVALCPECFLKMQASDRPHEYKLLIRKARSRITSTIEYHRREAGSARSKYKRTLIKKE
ncbi:MAG: HNH endonuclease [Deltaproteobacteria bacterium]|nr:HNH endonuclease [Deltaproteobacteria bacterium]